LREKRENGLVDGISLVWSAERQAAMRFRRSPWIALLLLGALLASFAHGPAMPRAVLAAGPASLVKDINPTIDPTQGSSPASFFTIGAITYFIASDPSNGRELWRTDGTAANTWLVKDLIAGTASSFGDTTTFVNLNGILFFGIGNVLWKSNGTASGTVPVTTIADNGFNIEFEALAASGGLVFFGTRNSINAFALWRSDGTAAGTIKLKSLNTSSGSLQLVDVDGTLFFSELDQLWKSNGTVAGTVLVKNIRPTPTNFVNAAGTLFLLLIRSRQIPGYGRAMALRVARSR